MSESDFGNSAEKGLKAFLNPPTHKLLTHKLFWPPFDPGLSQAQTKFVPGTNWASTVWLRLPGDSQRESVRRKQKMGERQSIAQEGVRTIDARNSQL